MNWKDTLTGIVVSTTLLGIGYTAALRGGYVIDEARAGEIAQEKMEVEERARLSFQREMKYQRLRFLNNLSAPTPDDELEMESIRGEIKVIDGRLAEIDEG